MVMNFIGIILIVFIILLAVATTYCLFVKVDLILKLGCEDKKKNKSLE